MFSQKLHPQVLGDLEKWTHICMVSQYILFVKTGINMFIGFYLHPITVGVLSKQILPHLFEHVRQ